MSCPRASRARKPSPRPRRRRTASASPLRPPGASSARSSGGARVALRPQRPIAHDERLTIVDHLSELRSRLVVSMLAFGVALALCFWQNHLILGIINAPLPGHRKPITFGVTEAFTTTFTNAAYAAILISLPVILYQLYAFVLPAFSPDERRVATPLLVLIPVLFIAGVVFCYFVVLPGAIHFLLN